MRFLKRSIFLFILFYSNTSFGQIEKHTLGIRSGGGGNGFGYLNEISYQLGLSEINRLELDLGFRIFGNNGYRRTSYLALSGVYQWVKPIAGDFTWFFGPAAQVASRSDAYTDLLTGERIEERYLSLGLGGQIGVDYSFKELNVPIQFGFDARPMFFVGNGSANNFGGDLAFHIRYIFN